MVAATLQKQGNSLQVSSSNVGIESLGAPLFDDSSGKE